MNPKDLMTEAEREHALFLEALEKGELGSGGFGSTLVEKPVQYREPLRARDVGDNLRDLGGGSFRKRPAPGAE